MKIQHASAARTITLQKEMVDSQDIWVFLNITPK